MSSFRDRLIIKLAESFDVNEDTIAEGIAQVIRGETVKEKKKLVGGEMKTVEQVIMRSPKDVLNGAIIYDALTGGGMGIAPKVMKQTSNKGVEVVHRRLSVDRRIIANSEEAKRVTEIYTIESEDEILADQSNPDYESNGISEADEVGNLISLYEDDDK